MDSGLPRQLIALETNQIRKTYDQAIKTDGKSALSDHPYLGLAQATYL